MTKIPAEKIADPITDVYLSKPVICNRAFQS